MFLTKINLDTQNHAIYHDLKTRDKIHAWIESAFPGEKLYKVRKRHLWSLENNKNGNFILLLSEDKPERYVLEKYATKVETKSYNIADTVQEGDIYQFKIEAYAVDRVNDKDFPCKTIASRTHWMNYYSKRNGFEVKNLVIETSNSYYIRKHNYNIISTTYTGILKVDDVDKFKHALLNGMGRQKAYGLGFLHVIKLK